RPCRRRERRRRWGVAGRRRMPARLWLRLRLGLRTSRRTPVAGSTCAGFAIEDAGFALIAVGLHPAALARIVGVRGRAAGPGQDQKQQEALQNDTAAAMPAPPGENDGAITYFCGSCVSPRLPSRMKTTTDATSAAAPSDSPT